MDCWPLLTLSLHYLNHPICTWSLLPCFPQVKELLPFLPYNLFKPPLLRQRYFAQCGLCSSEQALLLRHGRRSPLRWHKVLVPPGAPGSTDYRACWVHTSLF